MHEGAVQTCRRRARRGVGALLWLAAAVLLPAHGQERLRYGGDSAFAPIESLDAKGQPKGFQIDLLNEMARETGLRFEVRLGPWHEIEAAFRAGEIDAVSMSVVQSRRTWATFSPPHVVPVLAVYYRRTDAAPQSLADVAQRVIAIHASPPMLETRDEFFSAPGARVIVTDTPAASLAAVRDGRADVAVMSRTYADAAMAIQPMPALTASPFDLRLQSYAFATAPQNAALRERINSALARLEASGRLPALRAKWLGTPAQNAVRKSLEGTIGWQRYGLAALAAALLMAVAAVLWLLARRRSLHAVEAAARREAEQALQAAEERLSHSFSSHPDAMLITERGTHAVLDVNDACCRLVGLDREAIIGQPIDRNPQLAGVSGIEAVEREFAAAGGVHSAPVQFIAADGATRSCLVWSEPLRQGDVPCAFSIVREVTGELAANDQLRADYDAALARVRSFDGERAALNARAERADAEVVRFTGFVAHDLKAPLRAVRGFTGLLKRDLSLGRLAEANAHADQIDNAARRMDKLVDALTRLSRAGQIAPHFERLDMNAQVAQTWALIAAANVQRTVGFIAQPLPGTLGDAGLVAQVWQNVLENALKFTAKVADAKVSVTSFDEGGRPWYRVTDNGAGFAMDRAQNLFEPFQRMHSNEFSGTGIGLSLVRRVVRAHGGEVRATSAVGVGTVIEFCLAPQSSVQHDAEQGNRSQ